jgi:hypothetical protein
MGVVAVWSACPGLTGVLEYCPPAVLGFGVCGCIARLSEGVVAVLLACPVRSVGVLPACPAQGCKSIVVPVLGSGVLEYAHLSTWGCGCIFRLF